MSAVASVFQTTFFLDELVGGAFILLVTEFPRKHDLLFAEGIFDLKSEKVSII